MGLFDMINKAKGGSEPNEVRSAPIAANPPPVIPASLFGDRDARVEPPTVEWNNEAKDSPTIKDLTSQLGKMLNIGNFNEQPDERANLKGLFSEKYLQSVAALRLSQLKIKYNLKVSLLKMAFGKMLEAVGKDDQAKNVWDTQVTLGNMDEIIQEIIYLDLSHQNKMGTLKPISPDEFFAGMTTMAIEKIGGEGFENYIELATGGFEKVKLMLKPKPAQG